MRFWGWKEDTKYDASEGSKAWQLMQTISVINFLLVCFSLLLPLWPEFHLRIFMKFHLWIILKRYFIVVRCRPSRTRNYVVECLEEAVEGIKPVEKKIEKMEIAITQWLNCFCHLSKMLFVAQISGHKKALWKRWQLFSCCPTLPLMIRSELTQRLALATVKKALQPTIFLYDTTQTCHSIIFFILWIFSNHD